MRPQRFYKWLADSLTDFFLAVWGGDLKKIAVLASIAIVWGMVIGIRWVMFRRRARQLGLPLDGSIPADDWHPPSSEEVGRIINKKPSPDPSG